GEMAGVNEEPGWGRMSEPEEILDAAEEALILDPPWRGLRVLVTSGPTRESLDPIRFLSNRSSGKMGDALARQAHLLGAEVFLVRGVGSQNPPPRGPKVFTVESAQEMGKVVKELFPASHILIMAAAVSDWQSAHFSPQKMKRTSSELTLQLLPNEDILLWAGKHKTHQIVVGFAVETENHLENARLKLESKGADIILLKDPTQAHSTFGGETIQLTILTKEGTITKLPKMSKFHAAKRISEEITSRLKGKVLPSHAPADEVSPR
ncbi:MAG: phosphopantothenoylcysteine decarboxylase, partial [bacterium]